MSNTEGRRNIKGARWGALANGVLIGVGTGFLLTAGVVHAVLGNIAAVRDMEPEQLVRLWPDLMVFIVIGIVMIAVGIGAEAYSRAKITD